MKDFPSISADSKIFVLTGPGICQESGTETYRNNDGLRINNGVKEIAKAEEFIANPTRVYDFYNVRRKLNNGLKPYKGHLELVELEKTLKINIITQNIDNLHEIAGSSSIIYIHGELNKARCMKNDTHIYKWTKDLDNTHKCPDCGSQMRPHFCWYEEVSFQVDEIHRIAEQSALFVTIGTSGDLYPATAFVSIFKKMNKPTIELNLVPSRNQDQFDFVIHKPAPVAVEEFKNLIIKNIR